MARMLGNRPGLHLPLQRLICANQQLLASLPASVERTRYLHTTEGTVVKQSAILTRKRHALRNTLVNDVRTNLGQPVHVSFTSAVIPALDGVVKEAVNRVVVVAVILCRVNSALRSNRVCSTCRILVEEHVNVIAHLAKRSTCQPGTNDDNLQLTTVRRVH